MTRIVHAPEGSLTRGLLARLAGEGEEKPPTALASFMGMVAPPSRG